MAAKILPPEHTAHTSQGKITYSIERSLFLLDSVRDRLPCRSTRPFWCLFPRGPHLLGFRAISVVELVSGSSSRSLRRPWKSCCLASLPWDVFPIPDSTLDCSVARVSIFLLAFSRPNSTLCVFGWRCVRWDLGCPQTQKRPLCFDHEVLHLSAVVGFEKAWGEERIKRQSRKKMYSVK